jgi:hypothetical protein
VKRSLGIVALTVLVVGIAGPASASGHRLTRADRKAVNATLDVLVNSAVKRHDVAASFDIVTPTLRAGMTRKEWSQGSIPIYPYPARGTRFHGWTVKYVTPGEIAVELMLQPRKGAKVGPILFDVYLDPVRGKWLVDSFMPVATFAPLNAARPKVTALNDFMPRQSAGGTTSPARVSSIYAYVPFAVVGAILLALAAVLVFGSLRYRPRAESLPPLRGGRRTR